MNLPEIDPHLLKTTHSTILETLLHEEAQSLRHRLSEAMSELSIREGQLLGAMADSKPLERIFIVLNPDGTPDAAFAQLDHAKLHVERLTEHFKKAGMASNFSVYNPRRIGGSLVGTCVIYSAPRPSTPLPETGAP